MHEFSMTQEIVKIILAETEKHENQIVTEVVIEIGEFSFLVPEQVIACYSIIIKDEPRLKESELLIMEKRGTIFCNSCNYRGKSKNDGTVLCPDCSHPSSIQTGRDCIVKTIRMQ